MIRNNAYRAVEKYRERFQEARADLFCRTMQPQAGCSILDLGGNRGQFSRRLLQRLRADITVADILDFSAECAAAGLRFAQIGEQVNLPFADREFDIVLCNSVIEHVTLPKTDCQRLNMSDGEWRERAAVAQKTFAAEIRRVARGYFVQTPHPDFPLDLHLWLPFTNWLSHRATVRLTRLTDRFWIKSGVADWQLISPHEMTGYFPDAQLQIEHWLGMPKSVIAFKTPL